MGQFSADITKFIASSQKRIDAVARASIQDVVNAAQLSTHKGGNMPVVTGFLRLSGQFSYNGMPTGPIRGDKEETYAPIEITLSQTWTVGMPVFFGWTAIYAGRQEGYHGFLESAVQRWQEFVTKNCIAFQGRIEG